LVNEAEYDRKSVSLERFHGQQIQRSISERRNKRRVKLCRMQKRFTFLPVFCRDGEKY